MRNFRKICITTLFGLSLLGIPAIATTGTVNAPSGLVLREDASKSGNPIATVPDQTQVEVIEENGEWYKAKYDGQEGYLFKEFVVNITEQEKIQNQEIPETDTVQAKDKVKVYMIPAITSTVINEIDKNAEIKIEKEITNWTYITSGNIQGWVRTYAIKNDAVTPAPEETQDEPKTEEELQQQTEQTSTTPETTDTNEPADNSTSTETAVENIKGVVAVANANIREKPSTDSEIVTVLAKDTAFVITAETEEWYKITYTGIDGTVYIGYIYKNLATK